MDRVHMTSREITVALWIVIATAAVGLEILSHTTRRVIAPAGSVARLATRPIVGRVIVSVGWMWLGWHTFAR
jgi:hypothetical protein